MFLDLTYSSSDNLAPPISWVLIGRHLILCSLTSPACCNSPRKSTPVRYKARQKARFPVVTHTTSNNTFQPTHFKQYYVYVLAEVWTLKETGNSFKKWPLNLWWVSNKTIIEVGNITKSATFKSFSHLSYKSTQLLLLWQCFLINKH